MKLYVDHSGSLGAHRRAATGGLVVEATLARVGVLAYTEGAKTVRHLNSEAALLGALDGLSTAPVTNRHPSRFVDTSTYSQVARGHVVGAARMEDGHVRATLAIHDEKLIRDIELGTAREVSMGYHVEVSALPGVTTEGVAYDVVRDAIHWNHIAIVPAGRAGKTVRLLLDSSEIPPNYGEAMFKIDGKEVSPEQAQAAFDAVSARLEGLFEVSKQETAALKTELLSVRSQLADASSEAAIDAAVTKRLARRAEDEARAVRLEAVKKAFPLLDMTSRSQEAIDALFEVSKQDAEGLDLSRGAKPAQAKPVLSARDRMVQDHKEAFSKR